MLERGRHKVKMHYKKYSLLLLGIDWTNYLNSNDEQEMVDQNCKLNMNGGRVLVLGRDSTNWYTHCVNEFFS